MIQVGTNVIIADNTGAKKARVFKILGGSHRRYAGIGDIVVLSVKSAEPRKNVKKKDVHRAVVVRERTALRRKDGSYIRFDDNAVVILDKKTKEPKGGRIFGPIPRELSELGYQKIVSLAPEVL
jgi:large subunit ribosomal protein L14